MNSLIAKYRRSREVSQSIGDRVVASGVSWQELVEHGEAALACKVYRIAHKCSITEAYNAVKDFSQGSK